MAERLSEAKKRLNKYRRETERLMEGCSSNLLLYQDDKNFAHWMSRDNDVLNYFAGDTGAVSRVLWDSLESFRRTKGDALYTDLLFALTHTRFSSEEAKKLWDAIIVHKYLMSERMGRNVGVKVAALDYLDNQSGRIKDLQLLPEKDLDCLLLFVNEDGLTGLFNHRFFQERLRDEVMRCKRYNRTFSLLFLDLDHFKSYNDHFGHMKGDMLLRDISTFLKTFGREADIVARYGGDEFALILTETSVREAWGYAQRLLDTFVENKFGDKLPEPLPSITLSIGVANYPLDGASAEEIIEVADEALYRAKGAGRNCIRLGHADAALGVPPPAQPRKKPARLEARPPAASHSARKRTRRAARPARRARAAEPGPGTGNAGVQRSKPHPVR